MLITSGEHSIVVDVNGNGTDVWIANWKGDGFIRVYRGETNNNKLMFNHLLNIEFLSIENTVQDDSDFLDQLKLFEKTAYSLLEALIFPDEPQEQL